MANSNNIDDTISTKDTQILSKGLTLPQGFTNLRQPGELELLIQNGNNTNVIYNQYSYNSSVDYNQRPLLQTPIGTRRSNYDMATNDIIRVTKYTTSNAGVRFLTHQLILQGLNAFNETKLYNPIDPIAAATSKAAFGLLDGPTRFIEPNLGGVFGALGLKGISSLVNGGKPQPPVGTVANNSSGLGGLGSVISSFIPSSNESTALPLQSDGAKGLIRGKTATDAAANFNKRWPQSSGGSFGFGTIFSAALNTVKNQFLSNTALGTFFPVGQPLNPDGSKTKYKVGEQSYGVFLQDIRSTPSQGLSGGLFSNIKSSLLSAIGLSNAKPYGQLLIGENAAGTKGQKYDANGNGYKKSVYTETSQTSEASPLKDALVGTYTTDTKGNYPSNYNDNTDNNVKDTRKQLEALLSGAKKAGFTTSTTFNNYIAESYKDLAGIKDGTTDIGKSPINYDSTGKLKTYDYNVDNDKSLSYRKTLVKKGMDTNVADNINLKGVISGSNTELSRYSVVEQTKDNEYNAYADDLIAFNFYDIVNDRYIPFRVTVKGIQENLSAEWNDVKYINRADKLYTYGGFGRTLTFTFQVVITSVKELMPTWKRINYLAGLVKPSNYTNGTTYSRFIIPPLTKFTIGDMYKNQPAVITQIGIIIPDNAVWETLPETMANDKDWSYLNGRISWAGSKSKGLYAQFPNECEINMQMNLLEKELPHTGGSNYGDFYYDITQQLSKGLRGSFSNNLHTAIEKPTDAINPYE